MANTFGFTDSEINAMRNQAGTTFSGVTSEDAEREGTRAQIHSAAKEQAPSRLTTEEGKAFIEGLATAAEQRRGTTPVSAQQKVTGVSFRNDRGEVVGDSNSRIKPSAEGVIRAAKAALAREEALAAEVAKEEEAKKALLPDALNSRIGYLERHTRKVDAQLAKILKLMEAQNHG